MPMLHPETRTQEGALEWLARPRACSIQRHTVATRSIQSRGYRESIGGLLGQAWKWRARPGACSIRRHAHAHAPSRDTNTGGEHWSGLLGLGRAPFRDTQWPHAPYRVAGTGRALVWLGLGFGLGLGVRVRVRVRVGLGLWSDTTYAPPRETLTLATVCGGRL